MNGGRVVRGKADESELFVRVDEKLCQERKCADLMPLERSPLDARERELSLVRNSGRNVAATGCAR